MTDMTDEYFVLGVLNYLDYDSGYLMGSVDKQWYGKPSLVGLKAYAKADYFDRSNFDYIAIGTIEACMIWQREFDISEFTVRIHKKWKKVHLLENMKLYVKVSDLNARYVSNNDR